MITASGVEVRVGSRLLLEDVSFRVGPGDRVGLVGRNGAGKATLPQDPRTGDLDVLGRDRILSARGLDEVIRGMRRAEQQMADGAGDVREQAMARYSRLEARFTARGGYAAEAEAASVASSLGLPDRVLAQPLRTLSGGQRRRIELARILFSGASTLLLDEPTNHLDADSVVWLRDHLRSYAGGLVIISHDVNLIDTVVNKVFYLD